MAELLEGRTAIIYGGGGIGAGMARTFAREGAKVFLTARAAARRMIGQGSGVILHLNSASGPGAMPGMGSTGPADAATEAFMRYLAAEVGPHGVRVCGIWTAGVAETLSKDKLAEVGGADAPDPQTWRR